MAAKSGFAIRSQPVDFNQVWTTLSDGVKKIVTLTGVKGMPMIEDVYKLCIAKPKSYSETLYMHLKELLENHVEQLKQGMLEKQGDLLVEYLTQWHAYFTGSTFCNAIFRYLNTTWIKKKLEDSRSRVAGNLAGSSEVYEVQTLALVIWKTRVFDVLKSRLIRAIHDLLTKERDGEQANSPHVAGVILSFVQLGMIKPNKALEIYLQEFEPHYIKYLNDYYARESSAYVAENGVSLYMIKAEQRLEEEEARAKKYLDNASLERVRSASDGVLVDRHKAAMYAECEGMLRSDKHQDLRRMFKLLSRLKDGVGPMLQVIEDYIKAAGLQAVASLLAAAAAKKSKGEGSGAGEDGEEAKEGSGAGGAVNNKVAAGPREADGISAQEYVEVLLNTHATFAKVVKLAFEDDPQFVQSLDKACREFINKNAVTGQDSGRTSELLAKYADVLLKKGQAHLDETELEARLRSVILVFKYIDEKDIFQKFYAKLLARRLINETSVSEDAEKFMLTGLKEACGFEYIIKLQRMFTDIQTSTEVNERFQEHLRQNERKLKVDSNVLVLTTGSWPMSGTANPQAGSLKLPQEISDALDQFEKWYKEAFSGRRLNWLHQMGKCDVRILFTKKKYECTMTTHQMSLLMLFNHAESYTVEFVRVQLGLSEAELKRLVFSLVDTKLLKKSSAGRQLDAAEELTLNKAFQSKRVKFKINAVVQAETAQQSAETRKSVDEDRNLVIQAAIVRIMKARKTLTHTRLIQEVIAQVKTHFTPHIPLVKRCIEQLIEKEFLERAGDSQTYNYKA